MPHTTRRAHSPASLAAKSSAAFVQLLHDGSTEHGLAEHRVAATEKTKTAAVIFIVFILFY